MVRRKQRKQPESMWDTDESESDKSSNSDPSDSDESITSQLEVGRKSRSPSPEKGPINAEEAFRQISDLAERLRMKTRKTKIASLNWNRVLSVLNKDEVVAVGFSEPVLKEMWYIISTRGTHMTMDEREQLIFLLIPETMVSVNFVECLLDWFIGMHSEKEFQALLLPLLKYFLGLVDYKMIDGECFRKPYNYASLLACSANTDLVIPLFELLNAVTTKEVIQRFHIVIISCLWKKTVADDQKESIVKLLKLYEELRPDYIPGGVSDILY